MLQALDAGLPGNAISPPNPPDTAPPTTQPPASALAKSDMNEAEDEDSDDFAHGFHDGIDRHTDEQKMHPISWRRSSAKIRFLSLVLQRSLLIPTSSGNG